MEVQSNDVQIVIKSVESDGIIISNAKQFSAKEEDIKTTEYFLNIEDEQSADAVEEAEAQFVTVEGDDNEYIAVEIDGSEQIILNNKEVIIFTELCRICASESDRFIPIFTGEGLEHELSQKIHTYLPLRVSESDTLPLQVCYNCAATLLSWHEMVRNCASAQQRLTELQNKFSSKEQYYNESAVDDDDENTDSAENKAVNEEAQVQLENENEIDETMQVVDIAEANRAPTKQRNREKAKVEAPNDFAYMCGVCDGMFGDEEGLLQHLHKEHGDEMKDCSRASLKSVHYECSSCGKSYQKKINLVRHMQVHEKLAAGEDGLIQKCKFFVNQVRYYKCPDCETVMANRRTFLRHIRVHANERPVICDACGKSYRIEEDLRRHMDDVHRKIKRYACDICGKSFAAKATCNAHRRIHTGEKPFPCPVCGKNFRSINLLGIHKRIHTDYRPHQCSFCEKAFRDKQKLTAHEAIHTGIRPYPCDVCGKQFAAKGEANRHRSVHFADRPYLCSDCGVGFRLCRYLRTHIKTHHKDKAEAMLKTLNKD